MTRRASASAEKEKWSTKLLDALLKDFEELQEDTESCDLEFVVGPRQEAVQAHKLVVVCRCGAYKENKSKWLKTCEVVSVKLPNYDLEPVQTVIKYLYTGKMNLWDQDIFQVLSLCSEFGLPALKEHCIEYLSGSLTVADVCPMLTKMDTLLQGCTSEGIVSSLQEIVEKCFAFIESNSKLVLQSDGFVDLSKESLIIVISSDKLALPEEDIWRAVMRWGQHNACVKQTPPMWGQAEKARMKETLEGVLGHVRIMEINSEVFAKEVEPTGLLPMEMTLARYRQAAVSAKGGVKEHGRPRSGTLESFPSSEILAGRIDLQMQLNEWCEAPSAEWVLLYRGSRDGFQAKKFHSCCDDKGPTVIVVKTPSGNVFGGFTDVSWCSRFKKGKFASSQKSFLFTLSNPSNTPPTKFEVKQTNYAINNHPSNGPIFGSGADLCIGNDCNANKDSYSQLPFSYGDSSVPAHLLTGEQYFIVEDYEVFGLTK